MKRAVLASVMMVCGLTAIAVAAPPVSDGRYYATNFENPPFTVGNLNTQDGWIAGGVLVGDCGLGSLTMNVPPGASYAVRDLGGAWATSNTWVMSFTYWYDSDPGLKNIAMTDTGLWAQGGTLAWHNYQAPYASSSTGLTIAPYPGVNHIVIQRTGDTTARVWLNGVEGTSTAIGTSGTHDTDHYIEIGNSSDVYQYYDDLSIGEPPLNVTPASRSVGWAASTTTFSVSTTGGSGIAWTSAVVDGASWLTITGGGSGTDNGTVTVDVAENDNITAGRTGTIRVTATASGATIDVTIVQGQSPISDGQYYHTDFESPTFSSGALSGQDGWGAGAVTVGNVGLDSWTMNVPGGASSYAYHNLGSTWASSNSWAMSFLYWCESGPGLKNIIMTDTGLWASGGTLEWHNYQSGVSSPTGLTITPIAAPPYLGQHIMILRTGDKTARVWVNGVEGTPTTIGTPGKHDVDNYIEIGNDSAVGQYFDDLSIGEGPLNVTPANRDVGWAASTTTFSVIAIGAWSATVTSGASWLNITGGTSGTDNGTITIDVAENDNATAGRTGTIHVATASGATSDMTIRQWPYPTALPVSNGWYYHTDFENPPFGSGTINGVDGWYAGGVTVGNVGLGSQTMNVSPGYSCYSYRLLGNDWATSNTWVMSFTYWYDSDPGFKVLVLTDTGLAANGGTLTWYHQTTFANSPTGLTIAPYPAVNHIVVQRTGDTTASVWLNGVEGLPTDIGDPGTHDSDGYLEMGNGSAVYQYFDDLSIGEVNFSASNLSVVLAAMDSKPGDDNWNRIADLDNDGEITSTDLSIVLDGMN